MLRLIVVILFMSIHAFAVEDTVIMGIGYGTKNTKRKLSKSDIDSIISGKTTFLTDFAGNRKIVRYTKGGSLEGKRTKRNIMQVVMSNLKSVRKIYNQRLKENPGLSGKTNAQISINGKGKVIFCKAIKGSLVDSVFNNRLVTEIYNWDFGEIDDVGDTTKIVYPFVFSK